jgi:ATP-binding cassette subfamily B protein RaxB
MNHFVVLKEVQKDKVVIHDPAVGLRSLSLSDFSKSFTGVALELTPTSGFEKRTDKQEFTLFGLMGKVTGLKRGLLQVMLMAFVLELTSIVAPFYMQWVIDYALATSDHELISVLGVGFLLLVVIRAATSAVRVQILTGLSANLNFQWLGNVFSHMLKLPLDYFEKRHLGDIVSRFGSISTIQRILTTGFVQAMVDGVMVAGTVVMMYIYSPMLAVVATGAVVLYGLLRWMLYRPLRNATTEQIIHAAKQQTHFLETARGVQSVRLFGRSQERRMSWMNILVDQFNADLRIQKINNFYQTANTLLFGVERVIVIWLGALAVLHRDFSVGMLFAFLAYKDQFSTRISGLIDKLYELHMLKIHGDRVADIILAEAEPNEAADEMDVTKIPAEIEVSGLSFRYSTVDALTLNDVSVKIHAGDFVAIAGPSGCGKTTLVKLLLGLQEPTAGSVTVGGIPLNRLGHNNYRKMIGTVMQEDHLFTGSIADNISFFDPTPDQEWIEECARMAAVHNEIVNMPMGYNSLVGDIGSGMSGGQKQRVLLARALYKRPKILVLDEATSHLDVFNEKAVNESIKSMSLTRIVVAHRPETIAMASRVIMMDGGRIVRDLNVPPQRKADTPVMAEA